MKFKKLNICTILSLFLITLSPITNAEENNFGSIIQINTRFTAISGRPSWLIVIRDVDHGANIPYIYDITQANNAWSLLTYGRNYMILASTLQFAPYRYDPYKNAYSTRTIHNFCGLESRGRIHRGESMEITISGKLTPYTNTFDCNVLRYADNYFTIVNQ